VGGDEIASIGRLLTERWLIGADVNSPMEPSMRKPKKQPKPLRRARDAAAAAGAGHERLTQSEFEDATQVSVFLVLEAIQANSVVTRCVHDALH
jgi:hypothetical protein